MALGSSDGGSTDVYTAYENATVKQSDGFAYYPSVDLSLSDCFKQFSHSIR